MGSREIDLQEGKKEINEIIERLKDKVRGIRSNRVSTGLIEDVSVEAYESTMKLKEVAAITVSDGTTLVVTCWDKNVVKNVEKALRLSDKGLSLNVQDNVIYAKVSPLTEERRREFVKEVKEFVEDARQRLRKVRNRMLDYAKKQLDDKLIGEDEHKRMVNDMEKAIKDSMTQLEEILEVKTKEIME